MCNDQDPHVRAGQFCQTFTDNTYRVAVQSTVGFVQNSELWPQHGQLQDFHAFLFASGKPIIQIPTREFGIHVELIHAGANLFPVFPHGYQAFAFFTVRIAHIADRVANEIRNLLHLE